MNAQKTRRQVEAALTGPGQPFEMETVLVRGTPCRVFRHAPPTVWDLFEQAARDFRDRTYLVFEDERYTFAETHARAQAVARLLRERHGARPGDRVAIAMRNYPEWVFAFLGCMSAGAIAVGINGWWTGDEMEFALRDCGARVLFADPERLERIAPRLGALGIAAIAVRAPAGVPGAEPLELAALAAAGGGTAGGGAAQAPHTLPDDDALILYTSGSTGQAKGAVLTHRGIVNSVLSWELDGAVRLIRAGTPPPPELPEPQVSLLSIPLFHVSGSHAGMLISARRGNTLVLMRRWDADRAIDLIRRERVQIFNTVATVTGDLLRRVRERGVVLDSLLAVGGGGAPRPPEQARAIPGVFPKAAPGLGWGMTETNAVGANIAGEDYLQRPTSTGMCTAVLDMKIVDPLGRELPAGQEGELAVRGTALFRCYWNLPDATEQAFDNGWFRTGDLARFDADGYLYIVDRIKDIVIRGGENISCTHVEAALCEHPAVAEAAVFGVPDDRYGEEPAAVVVRRNGAALTEQDLVAHLERRLGAFQIPRYFRIQGDLLPRIASGKVDKRRIRGEFAQRQGAAQA